MNRIAEILLDWYAREGRDLPWRRTRDPYRIWLSEVILQQTRVAQGMEYYLRFTERFPDVASLAAAPEDEVLKLWQGLGYYSRARNLRAAAREVVERFGGVFPRSLDDVRSLRGVGDYTAAAICSAAYDAPCAVVDGNVYRVLSRLFDLAEPIDTAAGKRAFACLAQSQLDAAHPGRYNQAIMDFGALLCTPAQPRCGECPLADLCQGYAAGRAAELPVKPAPKAKSKVPVTVALIESERGLLLQRRPAHGLLAGLWQPAAWEKALTRDELCAALAKLGVQAALAAPLPPAKHVFTHKVWELGGWKGTAKACELPDGYVWAAAEDLAEVYPVPNAFGAYVKAK